MINVVIPFCPNVDNRVLLFFYNSVYEWRKLGFRVVIPVNAWRSHSGSTRGALFDWTDRRVDRRADMDIAEDENVVVIDGGDEPNPYPARNEALREIFCDASHEWVILTDGDCLPSDNYVMVLARILAPFWGDGHPHIIAGRVETEIPDIQSHHFQTLRAVGFECYGDNLDPVLPVGANMIINRQAWLDLGPMKEMRSGGDGIYGMELEKKGGSVTVAQDLVVTKTVFGMTLLGIMQKQLLNGYYFPDYAQPPLKDSLELVRMACSKIARIDPRDYPLFVDTLFTLMLRLGNAAYRADQGIE